MKATFLGTGCAMVLKRYNTCFLLEQDNKKLLVDAGGGNEILVRLDKLGVPVTSIGGMFVTHSHSDHILGTPWVIRAVGTAMAEQGYTGTFTVAACAETLSHVRTICEMILGKKMTKFFDKQILFREVTDGERLELCGFDITAFDIGSTKARQFGFTTTLHNERRLTCLGDEPYNSRCQAYAEGSDWLLCEAFCLTCDADRFKPYEKHHSTVQDAARQAAALGVSRLVLWHTEDTDLLHRKERYTREALEVFKGQVYVPNDGEIIRL